MPDMTPTSTLLVVAIQRKKCVPLYIKLVRNRIRMLEYRQTFVKGAWLLKG